MTTDEARKEKIKYKAETFVQPTTPVEPTTPVQPEVGSYSSYSSYLDNMSSYASQQRQATYAQAEQARQEAEALAEIQRKRGIVDASTMAAQQKATYGANAEQMGRMGLASSGYSDYLNAQAYASGIAARQNANAQAAEAVRQAKYQESLAKLEADKTYYGALSEIEGVKYAAQEQQEQQKRTSYSTLLTAIENGLDSSMIPSYAKALGITDKKLISNANEFAASYSSVIGADTEDTTPEKYEGYASFSEIDNAFNNLDISEEAMKDHKEKLNQNSVNQVNTFISQGDIVGASAKADELYDANQMTKETYQATKAELAQKNIEGIESIQDVHTVAEDLKKMLKKEEITKEEYNKKISAMADKAKGIINYGNVDMTGIKVSKGTTTDSYVRVLTINGNDYSIRLNTLPSAMKSVLENERPAMDMITEYKGKYYLYDTLKKNWFVITPYVDTSNPRATNNNVYEKLKSKVK